MSNQSDGGASAGNGGANPENKNQNVDPKPNEQTPDKMVAKSAYDQVSNDMHKYKNRVRELEAAQNQLETDRLKEKEEYKTLYEKSQEEANKWKKEAESGQALFSNTQKYEAVKRHAVQAGILDEAVDDLEMLDLEGVEIETTNKGRFTVRGAKEFVDSLKTKKPYWFKSVKAPKINPGGGGAKPTEKGDLTASDVYEAERQYKAGKITQKQYYELHQRYLSQRKK